jgi:hypothetical protein
MHQIFLIKKKIKKSIQRVNKTKIKRKILLLLLLLMVLKKRLIMSAKHFNMSPFFHMRKKMKIPYRKKKTKEKIIQPLNKIKLLFQHQLKNNNHHYYKTNSKTNKDNNKMLIMRHPIRFFSSMSKTKKNYNVSEMLIKEVKFSHLN